MTKSTFLILSLLLVIEILIGYGMLFTLQEEPQKFQANSALLVVSEQQQESSIAKIAESVEETPQEKVHEEVTEETVLSTIATPPKPIEIHNIELLPQGQLANPPEVIKAIYLTSWTAGSRSRMDDVINLARATQVNAVVIDIKDYSGELSYNTDVPEVDEYGAENIKIADIESVIQRLHEQNMYVIARVTVFQDPILGSVRPDLAIQSIQGPGVWQDYKGLYWIDPAAKEAWNYTVAIAKDAASRGFDEINFDYIRFPSDGDLRDMEFSFWDGQTPKHQVLKEFFAFLQVNIQDVRISADLFGLTTSSPDDLGIGQVIEDAYWHFDYVYPMVYPSHYASGYGGHPIPAEYPYEVVKNSLQAALLRLQVLQQENPEYQFAQLRPWLQDFDLGAEYDTLMVQAQVQATTEALKEDFAGFLLWSPTNIYTKDVLQPFVFNKEAYDLKERTTQEELDAELAQETIEAEVDLFGI